MNEPRDAMLTDIESRLRNRVPSDRLTAVVDELRSHLEMSVREHVDGGMSLEDAERTAVADFGSPKVIAERIIRRERGYDKRSAWRLAAVPILLLLLQTFVLFTPGIVGGPFGLLDYLNWVEMAFLASLFIVVWKTRRWIVLPLATVIVLLYASAPFMVAKFMPFPMGMSKDAARHGFQQQIQTYERQISEGNAILAGTAKPRPRGDGLYEAPVQSRVDHNVHLPLLPIMVHTSSQEMVNTGTDSSVAAAQAHWRQNGAGYLAFLRSELTNYRRSLNQLDRGENQVNVAYYFPMAAGLCVWELFVVSTINGLALLLARWWDGRTPRAKRLARA
jgi:hypothetical protein